METGNGAIEFAEKSAENTGSGARVAGLVEVLYRQMAERGMKVSSRGRYGLRRGDGLLQEGHRKPQVRGIRGIGGVEPRRLWRNRWERQEDMGGYGFCIEGKSAKTIWAVNDTAAPMQAMSIAMNGSATQRKPCRAGACAHDEPYIIREVASVNDDTAM